MDIEPDLIFRILDVLEDSALKLESCTLDPSLPVAYHSRYIRWLCQTYDSDGIRRTALRHQDGGSNLALDDQQGGIGNDRMSLERSPPATGQSAHVWTDEEWERALLQTIGIMPASPLQHTMQSYLHSQGSS